MDERTPEDIRAETYADQNGSTFLGYNRDFESTEHTPSQSYTQKSDKRRPTGVPLEGPGGGDISRMFAEKDARDNPMSVEQQREIRKGENFSAYTAAKEALAAQARDRRR